MKNNGEPSFFAELIRFGKQNKRWWIIPMMIILFLFGVLLVIAEVAPVISPFVYTLF
jgi:hypothetical protein